MNNHFQFPNSMKKRKMKKKSQLTLAGAAHIPLSINTTSQCATKSTIACVTGEWYNFIGVVWWYILLKIQYSSSGCVIKGIRTLSWKIMHNKSIINNYRFVYRSIISYVPLYALPIFNLLVQFIEGTPWTPIILHELYKSYIIYSINYEK